MHMQTEPFINTLQAIFQCLLITYFLLLSYISFSSYSIFLYFYFLNQKGPLKTKIISSMLVSIIWRSVCVPSLDTVSQKDNREEPVPRVIDTPPKREEVSAHKGKKAKEKAEGEIRWWPLNALGTLRREQLRHEQVLGKRKGKARKGWARKERNNDRID